MVTSRFAREPKGRSHTMPEPTPIHEENLKQGHRVREMYDGAALLLPELTCLGRLHYSAAARDLEQHAHPAIVEICLITRGQLDWNVAGTPHTVRAGAFFVTFPDEPHGGLNAVLQPCDLSFVQLRVAPLPNAPDTTDLICDLTQRTPRTFPASAEAKAAFDSLIREHRAPDALSKAAARAALNLLLVQVLRCAKAATPQKEGPSRTTTHAIRKALAYAEANGTEPLRVADLARASGLGLSQFHRRFKIETGQSPHDFVLHLRLKHAKALLLKRNLPVTQIAHALGFSSSQYFCTAFTRQFGVPPSRWRALTPKT